MVSMDNTHNDSSVNLSAIVCLYVVTVDCCRLTSDVKVIAAV